MHASALSRLLETAHRDDSLLRTVRGKDEGAKWSSTCLAPTQYFAMIHSMTWEYLSRMKNTSRSKLMLWLINLFLFVFVSANQRCSLLFCFSYNYLARQNSMDFVKQILSVRSPLRQMSQKAKKIMIANFFFARECEKMTKIFQSTLCRHGTKKCSTSHKLGEIRCPTGLNDIEDSVGRTLG